MYTSISQIHSLCAINRVWTSWYTCLVLSKNKDIISDTPVVRNAGHPPEGHLPIISQWVTGPHCPLSATCAWMPNPWLVAQIVGTPGDTGRLQRKTLGDSVRRWFPLGFLHGFVLLCPLSPPGTYLQGGCDCWISSSHLELQGTVGNGNPYRKMKGMGVPDFHKSAHPNVNL